MKFLYHSRTYPAMSNFVILLVRIFIGVSMILLHGLPKLEKYMSGGPVNFYEFLGLNAGATLVLALIVEIVASFLLIIGLFTRPAALLLMVTMLVAAFGAHAADAFSVRESSLLYFVIYLLIFTVGPLQYSVDQMLMKRRETRW